jgi:hypothetical protein
MKIKPILDKLSQESTWRGIISLVALFGVIVKPDLAEAIIASGVSLVALINIAKPD